VKSHPKTLLSPLGGCNMMMQPDMCITLGPGLKSRFAASIWEAEVSIDSSDDISNWIFVGKSAQNPA
jgi:hypothetical protein